MLQLNEEVDLLSNQKARLAGECEQYAMQVPRPFKYKLLVG